MREIDRHAPESTKRILVGTKFDLAESNREVAYDRAKVVNIAATASWIIKVSFNRKLIFLKELAESFGVKYFEISSKWNKNVQLVFASITYDILERVQRTPRDNPVLVDTPQKKERCNMMWHLQTWICLCAGALETKFRNVHQFFFWSTFTGCLQWLLPEFTGCDLCG